MVGGHFLGYGSLCVRDRCNLAKEASGVVSSRPTDSATVVHSCGTGYKRYPIQMVLFRQCSAWRQTSGSVSISLGTCPPIYQVICPNFLSISNILSCYEGDAPRNKCWPQPSSMPQPSATCAVGYPGRSRHHHPFALEIFSLSLWVLDRVSAINTQHRRSHTATL